MDKKHHLLLILIILAAGMIAYSNSFDCSFHFDDRNILNSITAKSTATAGDWIKLFPSRPLGILTFAANYHIHQLDVRGYHLVNLVIHLINALLVWWLTWMTFSTPVMRDLPVSRYKTAIAFLTGLLFVTHPLATQSVTYIVQRFASLATLFYLLSLNLFIKGKLQQNSAKALLLFCASVLSAVGGILTKEIIFTLPFAIILYDYCFFKISLEKPRLTDKSIILSLVIMAIFAVILFKNFSTDIFRTVESDQGYAYSISMKEYFLTQFRVVLTYIRLFFLPFHQNLDYDYTLSVSFLDVKTIFSFLALLSILLAGILLFKKYRLISFGIFWFFLTLCVESSIIPVSQNVIFEHRTYLPGFGFFIAFTGAFFYLFPTRYMKTALLILLVIAAFNTVLTYQRNKVWKNEYTLWSDCLAKSPNKARVNNEIGTACAEIGQYEKAIDYLNKAINLNPNYAEPYYNRGTVYGHLGQYQRTIDDCNEALRLKPDYVNAYNNRGNAYAALGFYQKAIEDYNTAIYLMPDYIPVYINRGNTYLKSGDEKSACLDVRRACELGNCKALESARGRGYCR
jgi:Tfp pilus assembly protein PilF